MTTQDYTPTKAEEIAMLRDTVTALGPNSYCAKWLSEQIPFIESDLRNDMCPSTRMDSARSESDRIIREANDFAATIRAEAEEHGRKMRESFKRERSTQLELLASTLRKMLRKVEDIS
jgi:hypothetical protein